MGGSLNLNSVPPQSLALHSFLSAPPSSILSPSQSIPPLPLPFLVPPSSPRSSFTCFCRERERERERYWKCLGNRSIRLPWFNTLEWALPVKDGCGAPGASREVTDEEIPNMLTMNKLIRTHIVLSMCLLVSG